MKKIFTPIDSLCPPPNAGVLELDYVLLLLFLSFPVAPVGARGGVVVSFVIPVFVDGKGRLLRQPVKSFVVEVT